MKSGGTIEANNSTSTRTPASREQVLQMTRMMKKMMMTVTRMTRMTMMRSRAMMTVAKRARVMRTLKSRILRTRLPMRRNFLMYLIERSDLPTSPMTATRAQIRQKLQCQLPAR